MIVTLLRQAKENAGAAGWILTDAEEAAIDAAAAKVPKGLIQNPNQST
jgi:aryl-alcohol dehydrogenase-like predicted oxidoreductase